MNSHQLIALCMTFLVGIGIGGVLIWFVYRFKLGEFETIAESLVQKAEFEAQAMRKQALLDAQEEGFQARKIQEESQRVHEKKMKEEWSRFVGKEELLHERSAALDRRGLELNQLIQKNKVYEEQIQHQSQRIAQKEEMVVLELEKIGKLSRDEAYHLLFKKIEEEARLEAARRYRDIVTSSEQEAYQKAHQVLVTSMNRLSVRCVSESSVVTVSLQSDDMKGRIIGKEGRNIRSLEQATGVNFIIDDTPKAVVISTFDPFRRVVAKRVLEELVADGRIHPTSIEETVLKVREELQQELAKHGEDACLSLGIVNLHPQLVQLVGQLKLRYSFGQNILDHSIEVAFLMGMMAQELGLDPVKAKRIGLLHDMGKAVSHEVQGSHAMIGYEFALKYGESLEIANGIGCHHGEMDPITVEGSLCSVADSLSASRPGARLEAVDQYIKRLADLEKIAMSFPGVERAFALQAGREIRVSVCPDVVDDAALFILAKDLSFQIEKKLTYPGKIKITVVREQRAVEYAV